MRSKRFARTAVPLTGIAGMALIGGLAYATSGVPAASADPGSSKPASWSQSWGTAMQRPLAGSEDNGPNWSVKGFEDHTLRQVVRLSTGGTKVRIRLSNVYGTKPLKVAGATIGRSAGGSKVWPGTMKTLTFDGEGSTTIRPGGELASDPVALPTSPLEKLAVTLRFTEATGPATFHRFSTQTAYRASGDHLAEPVSDAFGRSTDALYYLAGVDATGADGSVVLFGDSLVDGVGSTHGADGRLPDALAEALATARRPIGVVNAGIGGNRLRYDSPCSGEKATARFTRDVLDRPGVRAVIVHLGANDLRDPSDDPCLRPGGPSTAQQIIDAHRELVRAAHARGIKVIGVTIIPMKGSLFPVWTPRLEKARDAVNDWIRTGGEYDTVVDADRVLADPADEDNPSLAYVYEDGLHPNDAGYQAIAREIVLGSL